MKKKITAQQEVAYLLKDILAVINKHKSTTWVVMNALETAKQIVSIDITNMVEIKPTK